MIAGEQRADEPIVAFNWKGTDGPTAALVEAISEAAPVNPCDAVPLYEVVDPEALDRLFVSTQFDHGCDTGHVEFEYLDHIVVIEANGQGYIYAQKNSYRPKIEADSSHIHY